VKQNKLFAAIIAAIMVVGVVALGFGRANAATDSWSGKSEKVIPFSQALTSQTVAVVCTAVSSVAHNVRAITITNTASGYVRLYTSANLLGSNLIGAWGVVANTPLVLHEDDLGQGVVTKLGEGLYVDATTGTVSITCRIREDPVSPR